MFDVKLYITTQAVARTLGISHEAVAKMAARNRVRIHQVPGMAAKYHKADIEAIAARMLRVAGEPEPAPINQPASV